MKVVNDKSLKHTSENNVDKVFSKPDSTSLVGTNTSEWKNQKTKIEEKKFLRKKITTIRNAGKTKTWARWWSFSYTIVFEAQYWLLNVSIFFGRDSKFCIRLSLLNAQHRFDPHHPIFQYKFYHILEHTLPQSK